MDLYHIKRKGNKEVLKRNESRGVEYLTFPSLEKTGIVSHLFSTRIGGASEGIYASMNLSYARGDRKEAVDENFRRIAEIMGREIQDFVLSDQTHTANVRKVTEEDRGKGIVYQKDYCDVDGLITNERHIVLATFYADCVPLFLVDKKHRAIGLSHSGWKGTAGRMGEHTLLAMREAYGTNPEDVEIGIGPSICKDCYEVGEDLAEAFAAGFPDKVRKDILFAKGGGKYHLDLWKANEYIFRMAGVPKEQISVTDICTCCNPNYLFSHRASQGKRGNLGAFLCLI
ncbi:MAG: peptidoglycan editing factor PgeF [Lachnospiraceae bacterium]|jgi:YfiH family protein|nr:peptidoglycan editing factor PgeF [Lachnospiraceae bacterium]